MQNHLDQTVQRRKFYTILFFILAVAGGLKFYKQSFTTAFILFGAACVPWLAELILKPVSVAFFRGWMKFAEILGTINTYVIVTLLYFVMLTPVGLFLRFTGKARAYERESKKKRSSWIPVVDLRQLADRYTSPY